MPQILAYTLDVNAPLAVIMTPTLMMQGDKLANQIMVKLVDKDEPVSLDRWTALYTMERADGVRATVEGTTAGNVATVTLTDACYRVAGRYVAFLRVTSPEGEKRTILRLAGMVESEGAGPILDEEHIIPSIDDIVAQLGAMEAAVEDAEAATAAATQAATTANGAAQTATAAAAQAIQTVQDKLDSGELDGRGFQVLGYYDSLSALQAAVTSPSRGDAYGVGLAAPYDIYVWDGVGARWVNNGEMFGDVGQVTVNGVQAVDGNITLDADDVGAVPDMIPGITQPMMIITDAQGNVIASRTYTGDLTIKGTLTADKVIGAVYA